MDKESGLNNSDMLPTDGFTPGAVESMNVSAKQQFGTDNKKSLEISLQAIDAARAINYNKGRADALLQAGMCLSALRDYTAAMELYKDALDTYESLHDQQGKSAVYSKIGNVLLFQGKYSEALEQYEQALEIKTAFNDTLGVADLRTNSAIIYGLLGYSVMALGLHLEALKIFEALGDMPRVASSCSNIGLIYEGQQNYDEALKMYQHALEIRQERNDTKGISDLLNNIGNVHREKGNYERALQIYQSALAMRESSGDELKIAYSYIHLGTIYKDLKQYELALDYNKRALALLDKLNDKRGTVQILVGLGEVYFDLEQFDAAYKHLEEAANLAEETGLKSQHRQALMYITDLLERESKFEEALNTFRSYVKLDKELLNVETSRQISQMTLKKEIEQREKLAAAEKIKSDSERIKNAELQRAYKSLDMEKKRSEDLLLNILPADITNELKKNGKTKARHYDTATVLFADIVNFTGISEKLEAEELVSAIAEYFEAFDKIVAQHGIEKIKTIGDAYLCAGGLPVPNEIHAMQVVSAARDFLEAIEQLKAEREGRGLFSFSFRIGVHSGPLVAGVVGIKKFAYDIWGDTVNTSARMQQYSEPNRINLSHATYELVKNDVPCQYRGEIDAKHKGLLKMYFVA